MKLARQSITMIFHTLRSWLLPQIDDISESLHLTGYIHFIILSSMALTAIITPFRLNTISTNHEAGLLIAGSVILTNILFLYLLRLGYEKVVAYGIVIVTSLAIATALFVFAETRLSILIFVPLILLVTSALLGSGAVLIVGAFFDLLLIFFYWVQLQQLIAYPTSKVISIADLILFLSGITFLALLLYVIVRQIHRARIKISQQSQSLHATVAELQSMQDSLTRRSQELMTANEYLRSAQRQLVQAEKMAALGSLVAGISHEVNTPLGISITAVTTMAAATEELKQQYALGPFRRSSFDSYLRIVTESNELIVSNLQRVDELMQSFKHVAVDQITSDRRSFYLKQYLEEVVRSLEPKLRKGRHTINIEVDQDLRLISYPGAFAQIITNLVINSLIHGYMHRKEGKIYICAYRRGDRLQLQYRDDGQGIAAEHLGRIYEPFFTTARDRGGTGLGLHIVYNLVTQRLKGLIHHESTPTQGVTFFLDLPLILSEDSVLEDEELQ